MRLSKARKETILEHSRLNLSMESLRGIRAIRKFICRYMNKKIIAQPCNENRQNPKKYRSARRKINPLQCVYILRTGNSKYPYNPLITKKRKYGTTQIEG